MLKLAGSLGLSIALAELKRRITRIVRQGAFALVAAAFFLIGFCFLLVALHLWLSRFLHDPAFSAIIIGCALVLIALILLLVARQIGKGGARRPAMPDPAERVGEGLSGLQDAFGGGPAIANPALVISGLALVLGFVLGRGRKTKGSD
jgi:hypothetical protein